MPQYGVTICTLNLIYSLTVYDLRNIWYGPIEVPGYNTAVSLANLYLACLLDKEQGSNVQTPNITPFF